MSLSRPDRHDNFVTLFDYNEWATHRILDVMQGAPHLPDRALELLSHLLRTQDVWYGRVKQTDHADLDFWTTDSLSTCVERFEESTQRWMRLIRRVAANDSDMTVQYTNSTGTPFETPFRDILMHVVNHGTHHRAQIAIVLRNAEITPPPTDYIFYVREE